MNVFFLKCDKIYFFKIWKKKILNAPLHIVGNCAKYWQSFFFYIFFPFFGEFFSLKREYATKNYCFKNYFFAKWRKFATIFFNFKKSFRRIFATWRLPQKSSMTHTKGFSWEKKWHQKVGRFWANNFVKSPYLDNSFDAWQLRVVARSEAKERHSKRETEQTCSCSCGDVLKTRTRSSYGDGSIVARASGAREHPV